MTTNEIILFGFSLWLVLCLCAYAIWATCYVAKFERQSLENYRRAVEWEAQAGDALDAAGFWHGEYEDLKSRAYLRDAKGRIAKAVDVLP